MNKSSLLSYVAFGLVSALTISMFFLALPLTPNMVGSTKVYSAFFLAAAIGITYVLYSLQKKSLKLVWSSLTLPVLFFVTAMMAATFFTNSYPVENLLSMGGVTLAVGIVILLGSTMINSKIAKNAVPFLGILGAISAVLTGMQLAGFGPAQFYNSVFQSNVVTNAIFNLAGSPFIAAQFLLITLIGLVVRVVTTKHISMTTAITTPLVVIGLLLNVWFLLPGKVAELQMPSLSASWSVALDTIRSPRAALIGVGPSAYSNVYNQFKPVWLNNTPFWNASLGTASNAPLHMLTIGGFLLLSAWLFLSYKLLVSVKKTSAAHKDLAVMLIATVILQLIFPLNSLLLIIQGIVITFYIAAEKSRFPTLNLRALTVSVLKDNESTGQSKTEALTAPVYILSALLFAGFAFGAYAAGRSYASEVHLQKGNLAIGQNQGIVVYEEHQKAVELNPYLDSLRRQYAMTNLMIASALSEKADISEAEKAQVVQLLQQGIREARAAALLDPTDTQNHQVLAQIYQNMIGLAEGADQWTQQAYVSAINYNPTDPALRVALGGLFLQLEQPQSALNLFNQAAELKPDYANAYYNGANTLVILKDYVAAVAAYETLLKLLPPESEEYKQVTEELDAIRDQAAEQQKAMDAEAAKQNQAAQQQGGVREPQEEQAAGPTQAPNLTEDLINQGEASSLQTNPSQTDVSVDDAFQPIPEPVQPTNPNPTTESDL